MALPLILVGLVVAFIVIIGGALIAVLVAGGDIGADPVVDGPLGAAEPLGLLAGNLVIAVLTPLVMLAVLVVHRERAGWLSSAVGRLRWGLLWRFSLLATATVGLGYLAGFGIPEPADQLPMSDVSPPTLAVLVALLAVAALTTPLQAAGEEYAFRGYLTQAVAGWIPPPRVAMWVAGAFTAVLFALAHGVQDPALFSSRLVFGIVATWTVVRTGGLEAAIALHVVNNLVVLSVTSASGQLEEAILATTVPWRYATLDIAGSVLFGVLVALWSRRLRPQRRSEVAALEPRGPVGYDRDRSAAGVPGGETHGVWGNWQPG